MLIGEWRKSAFRKPRHINYSIQPIHIVQPHPHTHSHPHPTQPTTPTHPLNVVFGARFNSFRFRFASSKQFDLPSKWQVPVGQGWGGGCKYILKGVGFWGRAGGHGGSNKRAREREGRGGSCVCVWLSPFQVFQLQEVILLTPTSLHLPPRDHTNDFRALHLLAPRSLADSQSQSCSYATLAWPRPVRPRPRLPRRPPPAGRPLRQDPQRRWPASFPPPASTNPC